MILWETVKPIPTPIVTTVVETEVAMAAAEIEGDDNPLDFGGCCRDFFPRPLFVVGYVWVQRKGVVEKEHDIARF